jgi:hypothetical protein
MLDAQNTVRRLQRDRQHNARRLRETYADSNNVATSHTATQASISAARTQGVRVALEPLSVHGDDAEHPLRDRRCDGGATTESFGVLESGRYIDFAPMQKVAISALALTNNDTVLYGLTVHLHPSPCIVGDKIKSTRTSSRTISAVESNRVQLTFRVVALGATEGFFDFTKNQQLSRRRKLTPCCASRAHCAAVERVDRRLMNDTDPVNDTRKWYTADGWINPFDYEYTSDILAKVDLSV